MSRGTDLAIQIVNAYMAGRQGATMRGGLFTITEALAAFYKAVLLGTSLTPTLHNTYSAPPPTITGYPSLIFMPDPGGVRQYWGNSRMRNHEANIQGLLVCAPSGADVHAIAARYEDWPVALDAALTADPSLGGVCNNIRGVHGEWSGYEYAGLSWIGWKWLLLADTYYELQGNIAYVDR